MDPIMDVIKNSEEPEWLEKAVIGDLRLWQIMFLCLAGITSLIVMVCCCFRYRIPRTKQQIEADYQRRKITTKFRHELETIQDAKMDAMSLKDALDLLHSKKNQSMEANQQESQPSSIMSPQQGSVEVAWPSVGSAGVEAGIQAGPQAAGPQAPAPRLARLAGRLANISKLASPRSPTSPTPSGGKMDF